MRLLLALRLVSGVSLLGADLRPVFPCHRSPDTARIKSKMLYASSKEAIKKVLMGVGIHLTATDASELAKESIEDGVAKFL